MACTLGLLVAVLVTAASVQDSVAGTTLIDQVATDRPSIRKIWVDGGYRQHLVEPTAALGIDMQIVQRMAGAAPIPASSGLTNRHRLNRGGDRQLNRALHTIVLTRSRNGPATRAYITRRLAKGETLREIKRCLRGSSPANSPSGR